MPCPIGKIVRQNGDSEWHREREDTKQGVTEIPGIGLINGSPRIESCANTSSGRTANTTSARKEIKPSVHRFVGAISGVHARQKGRHCSAIAVVTRGANGVFCPGLAEAILLIVRALSDGLAALSGGAIPTPPPRIKVVPLSVISDVA